MVQSAQSHSTAIVLHPMSVASSSSLQNPSVSYFELGFAFFAEKQNREARTPKGDVNGAWSHDLFESNRTLSERLSSNSSGGSGAPRANLGVAAQKALRDAVGADASGGLNIKGASSVKDGNVVQVSGLVKGTSPADVEVCQDATPSYHIAELNPLTLRRYSSVVGPSSPPNSTPHQTTPIPSSGSYSKHLHQRRPLYKSSMANKPTDGHSASPL